jgi:hypothetical protein
MAANAAATPSAVVSEWPAIRNEIAARIAPMVCPVRRAVASMPPVAAPSPSSPVRLRYSQAIWKDSSSNWEREIVMGGKRTRTARVPCHLRINSFSEFNKAEGGDIWFALDETRPLACFAGIWTNWTSVRKVKEGETTNDLYAFLTTEPNAEVGAIHPKAKPVILTTEEEVENWMTAPPEEALKLQRPLPDGSLQIVARGVKEDPASAG